MKPRQADRLKSIHGAIVANDIEKLRQLARSEDGLMFDWLRRQAWPILMHTQDIDIDREEGSEQNLRDPVQISKDVERSLYYFSQDLSPCLKHRRRRELHEMIIEILSHNPQLHYYQGFHDVCTIFLLVLGKRRAIPAVENVALHFLRDGMLDSIDPVSRQLPLVTTLLRSENPRLYEFLMSANIMPFYTLSWVLTWFSHDLTDFDKVMRLFDLFMSSTPLMPVYVACAIVLSHSQDLLHQEIEMVHMCLVNLPQDTDMDIDVIVAMALDLEKKYPPLELQKRSGITLDRCSPVNTYETEWRRLSADEQPNRMAAERHLSMRRKTETYKPPEPRKRRPSLWQILSGGSLVVG